MIVQIQQLFLISALIGTLTCYARADYNLPLFIFAYMAWGIQKNQKVTIAWLIIFTFITDLIWLIYWGPFWSSEKFIEGYWENGIHTFVIVMSSLNLALKGVIFFLIYTQNEDVKHSLTPDGIKYGVANLCREIQIHVILSGSNLSKTAKNIRINIEFVINE